jgi:hypothetical protein
MNEQLIDTVIATATDEQVISLTKLLNELDIQMDENIKTANVLNSTLLNSKSFTELNKTAAQTAIQLEKVQQAQNKTAQTTLSLNETQAKVAAAQQAREEKAAAQLVKKQSAQAAADAKEIAAAEAKSAKLQAIQDEQNRKAAVQFPQSQSGSNPVTNDDSPAVRYEPIITGNEDMSASAAKSTEAIAAENAALLEQQDVLGSLTVEQRASIETLLALQAERAANTAELKALTVEDAASGERLVFLTAEQVRLKIGIQEVTVALNRQTKEALAADGAMTKLDQSVLLLRTSYEQLSVAERESEQGQAMLAELTALDTENKKLALTVGNTSKQIGDYEKAQGKASTLTVLADKVANQFTRSIIRMGVQFLLIGVIFGAVTWLYDLIKNMDYFTGRLDLAVQSLKNFADINKSASADAGKGAGSLKILYDATQDLTLSMNDRLTAAKELQKLYPDQFEASKTQALLNGQEKKSYDDLTKSIIENARADAAKVKIQEIESKIIDEQGKKAQVAAQRMVDLQNVKGVKSGENAANSNFGGYGSIAQGTSVDEQKKDINAVADTQQAASDKTIKSYNDQIAVIEKIIGLHALVNSVKGDGKGDPKTPKPTDKSNTELLEYYRLQLEEAQKNSKLIVDDDTQSYNTRLQALKVYEIASKALVKNAENTALADKNIDKQKRLNIELEFKNKLLDIDRETAAERLKLAKENLATLLDQTKDDGEESINAAKDINDKILISLNNNKDAKIRTLDAERSQNKVSERKYNEELLAINDGYNIAKIAQEIQSEQAILAIRKATRDTTIQQMQSAGKSPAEIAKYTAGADNGIQSTQNNIDVLGNDLNNAITKQTTDGTKGGTKDAEAAKKQAEEILQDTLKGIDEVDKLRQKAFEAEIARLEKQGALIEENAQEEKNVVNGSIVSAKTKANEIAVIDAKEAAQKQALQAKINQEKHKQDVAEKEATIAKIAIEGALAIIKGFADNGYVGAILAGALVAIELATAIATPLPTYAKGGNWKPGLGIWGEAGMERANLPDGSVQYSDGTTLSSFPLGTTITPHMELMQQIRPEAVKFAGGEQVPWNSFYKELKKLNEQPKQRNKFNIRVNMDFEMYKQQYLRR